MEEWDEGARRGEVKVKVKVKGRAAEALQAELPVIANEFLFYSFIHYLSFFTALSESCLRLPSCVANVVSLHWAHTVFACGVYVRSIHRPSRVTRWSNIHIY